LMSGIDRHARSQFDADQVPAAGRARSVL